MKSKPFPDDALWSIILAGGEGLRLKPFIRRWMGRDIPKQYCSFTGSGSMLQHTLRRADLIGHPDRKVTIIAREHQSEALKHFDGRPGRIVIQPSNQDTAAGIFLPLAYVRASNPEAIVVLFPSDHFIHPEERFRRGIHAAASTVQRFPNMVVLVGVKPDGPETDYGWIYPGSSLGIIQGYHIHSVKQFVEKPAADEVQEALELGAQWNTLICVAHVETLWKFGTQCFPDMMDLFERMQRAIDTPLEMSVLDSIYHEMTPRNFSTDLLQKHPERLGLLELSDIIWSDWGRPERVVNTLRHLGRSLTIPDQRSGVTTENRSVPPQLGSSHVTHGP